jgi:helix-turn-helix protein
MTDIKSLAIEELKRLVTEKGSKKAAAEALDIHPSYLGEILNGTRDLSDNVLEKIGYEKVVVHVKEDRVPKIVRAIETALELPRSK